MLKLRQFKLISVKVQCFVAKNMKTMLKWSEICSSTFLCQQGNQFKK